jgi:hypothetical protein
MKTSAQSENGIVAILDALGTATYSEEEIHLFMDSRNVVMNLLKQKAEDIGVSASMITTFTFNDTIVIVLKTGNKEPQLKQLSDFFLIVRKFMVDSMAHGILFRGAIAIGSFHANAQTNTVMGPAVTDAAAWYNKSDWIGLHATPRATLIIQRWLEHNSRTRKHVMLDYDVPLKVGGKLYAKVVNWPKVFFVKSISPCDSDNEAREKLLEFLSMHQVPLGTETKFFNTLQFFDFAIAKIKEKEGQSTSTSKNVRRTSGHGLRR